MDLVYPEDAALVMSKWNTLLQGISVYFEMRWKNPKEDPLSMKAPIDDNNSTTMDSSSNANTSSDDFLWIITACVPIMDDAGNLVCISGNITDISVRASSRRIACTG
jgi:hypothetical protein